MKCEPIEALGSALKTRAVYLPQQQDDSPEAAFKRLLIADAGHLSHLAESQLSGRQTNFPPFDESQYERLEFTLAADVEKCEFLALMRAMEAVTIAACDVDG